MFFVSGKLVLGHIQTVTVLESTGVEIDIPEAKQHSCRLVDHPHCAYRIVGCYNSLDDAEGDQTGFHGHKHVDSD